MPSRFNIRLMSFVFLIRILCSSIAARLGYMIVSKSQDYTCIVCSGNIAI